MNFKIFFVHLTLAKVIGLHIRLLQYEAIKLTKFGEILSELAKNWTELYSELSPDGAVAYFYYCDVRNFNCANSIMSANFRPFLCMVFFIGLLTFLTKRCFLKKKSVLKIFIMTLLSVGLS